MNCSQCATPIQPRQSICRCGFNAITNEYCRPTTNETYFAQQSFGRKKWESLVLHALTFSLRDVYISFQHHVTEIESGARYLIDAYLPDINLAIEIDEDYHGGEEQIARDQIRETVIRRVLNCEIVRIDTYTKPVFEQIDQTVFMVRQRLAAQQIPSWMRQAPEERQIGEYSAGMIDELERAGAFSIVEAFADEVRAIGFEVEFSSVKGIPSPGNGETGFVLRLGELTLTLNRRKTPGLRLLIADRTSADRLQAVGYRVEAHQLLSKPGEPEDWKYFSFSESERRMDSKHMLDLLRQIAERMR
jgi:very-short-patch-repair endonuclease